MYSYSCNMHVHMPHAVQHRSDKAESVGAIVGGTLGGLILLVILAITIIAIVVIYKRM